MAPPPSLHIEHTCPSELGQPDTPQSTDWAGVRLSHRGRSPTQTHCLRPQPQGEPGHGSWVPSRHSGVCGRAGVEGKPDTAEPHPLPQSPKVGAWQALPSQSPALGPWATSRAAALCCPPEAASGSPRASGQGSRTPHPVPAAQTGTRPDTRAPTWLPPPTRIPVHPHGGHAQCPTPAQQPRTLTCSQPAWAGSSAGGLPAQGPWTPALGLQTLPCPTSSSKVGVGHEKPLTFHCLPFLFNVQIMPQKAEQH